MARKKKMRRFLRRPKKSLRTDESKKWASLYRKALRRAQDADDPRLKTLMHYEDDPRVALKRLSIVSEVDLEREFPRGG